VVIPGANGELRPEDLEAHTGLFRDAACILAQLEIPMETVIRLGEIAAEYKVPFLLDPAPARDLSPELLRHVTWLTPNETETQIILKGLQDGGQAHEDPETEAALSSTADRLLAAGARNVILKRGSQGVYLAGADVERQTIPPFHVNAVDTTAAGDAFNGGFAYALTQGRQPAEAARFACAVAAISVTRTGAQPSMPVLEEVHALMNQPS
jgi:ribokinase